MSKRYLDSLSRPNATQISLAKQSGFDGWAGYLGGPTAAGVWSANTFNAVRNGGLRAPGFIVGLATPTDSVRLASNHLVLRDVIGHDIETQSDVSAFTDAYADQWASAIRSAGFRPVLYGLPTFCGRFGSHYDGVWYAGGPYYRTGKTPPPNDPRDGGFSVSVVAHQGWQWYGTHDFNGIGVDESVCDDWFVGETDLGQMHIDVSRSIVFATRLLALGSPGTQAAIDAYAGPMSDPAQSAEQWLTNLQTDLQNDPAYIWNRISKLQAAVDAAGGNPALQQEIDAIKATLRSV